MTYYEALSRITILGVRVDRIDLAGVRAQCRVWLGQTGGHQIATVNPEFVMEAQRNVDFARVLRTTSLNVADGVGLLYAARMWYGREGRLARVTGVDLTWALCELSAEMGAKIYMIGGGEGVAVRAAEVLRARYPSLQIVGAEEGVALGDASSASLEALLGRIYVAKPDVLFVAFGAPKQDLWIAEHMSKFPTVKIAMGIGGTLDYIAGVVPYAPVWVRRWGFEWGYRLVTQPHRLNRIITATVRFPIAVLMRRLTSRTF